MWFSRAWYEPAVTGCERLANVLRITGFNLTPSVLSGCAGRKPIQFRTYCNSTRLSSLFTMSSPVRVSRCDYSLIHSSSPDLPALGELFRKSPRKAAPLRSGSNAAAIPMAARSTFTSAADVLREAPEIDIDTEQIPRSPPRKAKPARKPRAKAQTKPNPVNDALVVAKQPLEVELSPKRFKSKSRKSVSENELESGQKALPKGRVTKATTADKSKVKKRAETVSKHFACAAKDATEQSIVERRSTTPPPPSQPREPALARRTDWTPPCADSAPILLDSELDNSELLSSIERATRTKGEFGRLLSDFALKTGEPEQTVSRAASESASGVLNKRKRLEFVSFGQGQPEEKSARSREISPVKAPVAKKKPRTRTITELATAPYAAAEIDVDLLAPGNKESLLKYFDTDGQYTSLVEHQAMVMDKNNGKPKKQPAKPRKKKGATVEDPILLSPSTALKQTTAQDFLFGTSSQLVTEDSPSTLRNLQAAIKASEQDDDPFASSPTTKVERNKRLWNAGARDTEGDLLEADEINLAREAGVMVGTVLNEKAVGNVHLEQSEYLDIDKIDINSPQTTTEPVLPDSHFSQTPQTSGSAAAVIPISASSTTKALSSTNKASLSTAAAPAPTPRPNYELFTDAQLAKQTTSYGFKPVKRRQAMIALLDQCWVSQHPESVITQPNLDVTASLSPSDIKASPKKKTSAAAKVVEPAKKPRGRPKKVEGKVVSDSTTACPGRGRPKKTLQTAIETKPVSPKRGPGRPRKSSASDSDAPLANKRKAVTPAKKQKPTRKMVEIADSEVDDTLSLSEESLAESVFSSPPPLDLSMSEEGETSLNLTPTEQEAILFSHITKAVTSCTRSTDPSEPSWYEKMLIYDPVVLEDLTAWLNTGQLTRVGYDGEASANELKKWCESKSVICLWKATTRGKERKRY